MKGLRHFGKYCGMLGTSVAKPERLSMYWKELFRQMQEIGIGSLIIVVIINVFIGAVSSVQTAWTLYDSYRVPSEYIGYVVRDSVLLELCPTITCIVLAGKVGSQITSELGSMRISEQIDALEIMGVHTPSYLIAPKIIASLITIPLLICVAAFLSLAAGMYAGEASGFVERSDFIAGLQMTPTGAGMITKNVSIMITKAFVFSFIISSIACYQGFFVKGGAIEIGKASTRSVVYGNIFILVADYFLIALLT